MSKRLFWFALLQIIFISASHLTLVHASNPDTTNLVDLSWMIGTWQRESAKGLVYERWVKVSDQTFEGSGYRKQSSEEKPLEYLRLEQFGSEIFYTAKVAQNPYPVPFKLVKGGATSAVFENPNHDFPQRITYTLQENGSLHARIEGPQEGQTVGVDFFFRRAGSE